MPLLAVRELSLAFGGPTLLDRAQCTVQPRERICVLGRNGEGKSTLLQLLAGELEPDAGEFERQPGLRIATLPQDVPETMDGTVFDITVEGAGASATLLRAYHEESLKLADPQADMDAVLAHMAELQHELEATGGWQTERRVTIVLNKLGLNPDAEFSTLSGGMKRRVLLGRALVSDPDILLLDEPTNHLDLPSIAWLEEFLLSLEKSVIFITHDRAFLRKMATRIWELDRGKLRSFDCGYDDYLLRKEALLEAEAVQNAAFDKKLAKEEVWIRQGVKARRTRNEGRVRALKTLRSERSERREQREGPAFGMADAGTSGAKVITADKLTYHWGEQPILREFSTTIWRGDKVGLIGPNGSGKTTLLQLLLGKLTPEAGTVKHGTQLKTAYFDQHRITLDPEATVRHAVADGHEHIVQGDRKRHVLSYLQEFLFSPEMARQPVKSLSGGERNRLLLARLFARPANLLVLDEPTNDLDLESLELLEDLLLNYTGTLILVSHDREFLDNVAGYTFAMEAQGTVRETVGGYAEYERTTKRAQPAPANNKTPKTKPGKKSWKPEKPRTRNNREKRELESLPAQIETLEAKHTQLGDSLGDPTHYQGENTYETAIAEMKQVEHELETLYARWQELEAIPG